MNKYGIRLYSSMFLSIALTGLLPCPALPCPLQLGRLNSLGVRGSLNYLLQTEGFVGLFK